ncbi:HAAS signaling domain-containing protein [Streptomyces sp. NPDC127038]|uniref:HAAS signaling domain-containing protein n=1 Tax=Streptomyces sp. NPDC127038 TaxID=3347114 RepID=UPI003646E176
MGIESDQLVFDYLSRVGDLAQQRQLPSGTRMRLVTELRAEIDRRRAGAATDSPAAVRRILDRLGTPDEIVAAAGQGTGASPEAAAGTRTWAAVPPQRDAAEPVERPKGLRRVVPRPRPAPERSTEGAGADAPSPPHLASASELGDSATRPDWWRSTDSPFGLGDSVPGFVGGVEIPELLKPPPGNGDGDGEGAKPAAGATTPTTPAVPAAPAVEGEPAAEAAVARRGPRRFLPRPGRWTNPLLLLAAALLVAGAVLGNWFALGLGWLIAYGSRRLTPAESKWAVLVLPGLSAAAGIVWLWGRANGRWGTPVAAGHMNEALAQTWPFVVRGAAIASALYLVWRSQRLR